MVLKRYLGYGTTNSEGVATLDHNPNGQSISGYTGIGAGEVDIVAECTIDGILVSQPYTVWDTVFFDIGKTSNHNDTWTGALSYERFDDYTLVKTPTSSGTKQMVCPNSASSDCTVEMKIQRSSAIGNIYVFINDQFLNLGTYVRNTDVHDLKLTVANGVYWAYLDGDRITAFEKTVTAPYTYKLQINQNDGSDLKYHDLKIYYI